MFRCKLPKKEGNASNEEKSRNDLIHDIQKIGRILVSSNSPVCFKIDEPHRADGNHHERNNHAHESFALFMFSNDAKHR